MQQQATRRAPLSGKELGAGARSKEGLDMARTESRETASREAEGRQAEGREAEGREAGPAAAASGRHGQPVSELDRHLVEFGRLLRELGVRVSASEILDAMQGLALVGLEDRHRVQAVLQATLIKDPAKIAAFEEAFRVYFAPPEQRQAWEHAAGARAAEWQKKLGQSKQDLTFQGRELELPEEYHAIYASLPEEEQQRLRDFLAKSSQGMKSGVPVDHSFQPMIERVVRGSLEYWRRRLGEDEPLQPPGATDGVMAEVERSLRQRELHYLAQDLKKIAPEDWPLVIKLIRRLTQRLASEVSRRYRAARRRGGVDIRRTLRQNLRYGGALVERRYRARRQGRPRFVLLCDISGSMLKYTEFVLQFVYGLAAVASGIETFVFGEGLIRLTDKLNPGQSFAQMVEEALPAAGREWGGGTNLAASLDALAAGYASLLTRRTVLLIVSDAQTLEGERAAALLKEIRRRVREVLWLNTLPERRWAESPAVALFTPYARMYECYTLGHLLNILRARL